MAKQPTMESLQEIVDSINERADELEAAILLMKPIDTETVESILQAWAENHEDMSLKEVIHDLRRLIVEEYLEERRKQLNSGNE